MDLKQSKISEPEQNANHFPFRPQSTICNVKYKEQIGTGAIYGYEFPEETWRTLFITSNQVLSIADAKEVTGLSLEFKEDSIGNDVTPDWVKWLWTSSRDQLNVTVIEFSPIALKVLSRMKYDRLISATPIKNEKFTVPLYKGDFVTGTIVDVKGDNIQFKIDLADGNSGHPLLNDEYRVVGIHVGLWDTSNESGQVTRHAINIRSILEGFKEYVLKSLGGKSETELWLEKISQIPKAEYELIGGGGYVEVYKIKIQSELFAVKIVGKLNDYEAKVRALKKEYGVVTSLDNHPRIIQFFGFVTDVKEIQLMIIMEYLEGGSLSDKLKDKKPLPNYSVYKYFVQILEGVEFLHQRKIYHSDIKPANILLTFDDNIKICDFGIEVRDNWSTKSSATSSNIKGDFHYMSPERLNNALHSATNDIWSLGATFVEMISGQPINHEETFPQIVLNIIQYKIFIKGKPYSEFLQALSDEDYKKKIITRTLCKELNRANCQELLSLSIGAYMPLTLVRRITKQTLIKAGEKNLNILGMSYNSARDELFLADRDNGVVRSIDNAGDLRDVYRSPYDKSPFVWSVCHMSDSDTLLVCSGEDDPDRKKASWLVALSRNGSEWLETHRVETDMGWISCALSDNRVLIGGRALGTTYMELFSVESDPSIVRIHRIHRIHVPSEYLWFSATCGSDTLVAMTYQNPDHSVRVHRLSGYLLEELAIFQFKCPTRLLWLADRLLVADFDMEKRSHAVIELEVSDTRHERRLELIATSENILVRRLCAVDDRLAIVDSISKDILHYSFA